MTVSRNALYKDVTIKTIEIPQYFPEFNKRYLIFLGFLKIVSWKYDAVQRYDLADKRLNKAQQSKDLGESFNFNINKLLFSVMLCLWCPYVMDRCLSGGHYHKIIMSEGLQAWGLIILW